MQGIVPINKPQGWTSFDVVAVLRKTLGIKKIGIEITEIYVVFFLGNNFSGLDPLVTRRHGIQPEVDEHSKTVTDKPIGIARCFSAFIR